MPTQPYMSAGGKRVPGVTTVIGGNCGWNKDPLMGWANREGLAGRDIRAKGGTAQTAAAIGDVIHGAVEAVLLGDHDRAIETLETAPLDQREPARTGFDAFASWYTQSPGLVVATELFGVDEEYQTGWCLDALRLEDDGLSLVDWKTSKGTYADHFLQVAAYTVFFEKAMLRWGAGSVTLTGAHVVRFDKFSGMFSHKFWPRRILDVGWNAFTWLRALHEVRWTIEGYTR